MRKRYALVGTGSRGYGMFARPLVEEYGDVAELVALCDLNPHRLRLASESLTSLRAGSIIPVYTDFGAMLAEVRPDTVIVCTVDATHHLYILQALAAGCDVITEKPMTTTAEGVRAILEAERQTGRWVRVSFNARYGAPTEELQRLLRRGTVGRLVAVDFAEYLDTAHGADYFRRWHRRKANSGGLLIHKASHHFDQLNWWIGSDPETVYAQGARGYYGAEHLPPELEGHAERCLLCPHHAICPLYLDLRADPQLHALYLDAEAEDGYYRDRCVFAEEMDIEDTMQVTIRYANGVLVSYVLYAFMPYEGQRIAFSGDRGRMEVHLVDRYHGKDGQGRLGVQTIPLVPTVRVSPLFGRPYAVAVEERSEQGGHGGADERIRRHLFREEVPDPLAQRAGSRAGAMSVLIGVAAVRSIETGLPVKIADLQ